jgi:hypothetical protein
MARDTEKTDLIQQIQQEQMQPQHAPSSQYQQPPPQYQQPPNMWVSGWVNCLIVSHAIGKLFSFVGDRIAGSVSGLARIMACSTAVLSFICNFLELLGNYGYICFGNLSACMVFFLFFDGLFGDGIVELVVQCE